MKEKIPLDERLEALKHKAGYQAFALMNVLVIIFFFSLYFLSEDFRLHAAVFGIFFISNVYYSYKAQETEEFELKEIYSNPARAKRLFLKRMLFAPCVGAIIFAIHYWGLKTDLRSALIQAFAMMIFFPLLNYWFEKREAKKIIEKEKLDEEKFSPENP